MRSADGISVRNVNYKILCTHKTNNYSYSRFRENALVYIRSLSKLSRLITKHTNHILINGRHNRQTTATTNTTTTTTTSSSSSSSSNSSNNNRFRVAVDCGWFNVQPRGPYTHMLTDL